MQIIDWKIQIRKDKCGIHKKNQKWINKFYQS
jgi:hypothetical protein